eukprot:6780901-Pyramimonas_sp.AAC.1
MPPPPARPPRSLERNTSGLPSTAGCSPAEQSESVIGRSPNENASKPESGSPSTKGKRRNSAPSEPQLENEVPPRRNIRTRARREFFFYDNHY